jgi:hypothetical protein
MIRIAISLAAYKAIASAIAEEPEARTPEPLEVGEGVGLWLDPRTLAVLRMVRMAGEGYRNTILRLFEAR